MLSENLKIDVADEERAPIQHDGGGLERAGPGSSLERAVGVWGRVAKSGEDLALALPSGLPTRAVAPVSVMRFYSPRSKSSKSVKSVCVCNSSGTNDS